MAWARRSPHFAVVPGGPNPIYREQVLEVEPHGIEHIAAAERHGRPRDLFGLWFAANAEIATWTVGVLSIALYGTSLRGALIGLLIGNVAGFALLGVLSTFGPRYGVPQMVQSRAAFGFYGNMPPATLSFLAGVGWFAINTVFGSYALQTLTQLPYALSLIVMLAAQVIIAVYGYNMIHAFERVTALALAAGFTVLGFATIARAQWTPFNAHVPLGQGGEAAGIVLSTALAFSYATGWVPCASDYSRYLPARSDPKRIWLFTFLGAALPCIVLESMGAATVTAIHGHEMADASPTDAISYLLGSGLLAKSALLTVTLGTLTANCLNIYSGAMSALVIKEPRASPRIPLLAGALFAAATAAVLLVARTSPDGKAISYAAVAVAACAVGVTVTLVSRYRLQRWQAAVLVGGLGALLAVGGGHPTETAKLYTNFLLLLSYWAAPWAAVVLAEWSVSRRFAADSASLYRNQPAVRSGLFAWLGGLLASLPFWDQAWFVGPVAAAHPGLGDISYYVGFVVAGGLALAARLRS